MRLKRLVAWVYGREREEASLKNVPEVTDDTAGEVYGDGDWMEWARSGRCRRRAGDCPISNFGRCEARGRVNGEQSEEENEMNDGDMTVAMVPRLWLRWEKYDTHAVEIVSVAPRVPLWAHNKFSIPRDSEIGILGAKLEGGSGCLQKQARQGSLKPEAARHLTASGRTSKRRWELLRGLLF